jgi:hypothetical protein
MKQTCIMNAWNEGEIDSEYFGARIAEIRVAVEKIWWKVFQGPICDFGKWLGLYSEIFSDSRGSICNMVDCGLILENNRGLFVKVAGIFLVWIYFWMKKGMHSVHRATVDSTVAVWWGQQYFGYNHSFRWDTWLYHTITSTTIKSSGKFILMLLRL